MNKTTRLLKLIALLGGKRNWSVKEIARHLAISERTAFRYLTNLEDARIPVVSSSHGYRLMEGARIQPLNFTLGERAILKLALANSTLRRQSAIRTRLETLQAKLDAIALGPSEARPTIRLEPSDRSGDVGRNLFAQLETAINEGRAAEILYTSLTGGTTRKRSVDPYRVVHRGAAWYLVALCHEASEIRNFRLDRIASAELGEHSTRPRPDEQQLDNILGDAWSAFTTDTTYDLVLRFAPRLAPLILNAQHHANEEKEQLADGHVEYRLQLKGIDEFARWIVGFGGEVEIVEPVELRERVIEIASGCLASLEPSATGQDA